MSLFPYGSNAFGVRTQRESLVFAWALLMVLAGAAPIVLTKAQDEAFAQHTASRSSTPQDGATMELSVYHSKYDGGVTKYGRTYSHWHGTTCASNNPAHKMKVLRVTYKGKSLDVLCIDTGGDKRLGYTRLDISGKAMKFFAPKWNGKDKGAPLLKEAKVVKL